MKTLQTARERPTLSHYARLYCPWGMSGRREVNADSARRAFLRELTLPERGQLPLMTRFRRMGWRPGRALTPAMQQLLQKKFGDPL